MDGQIGVRAGREADFDALTDLWERAARSSHGFLGDEEFTDMRPFVRDAYLPSMDVWVAERDGVPLAFVGVRDGHVELLYVDPAHHGRGLGTMLLDHVGATSVEVYADNATGVGFYSSQGFVETRRRERDAAGRRHAMVEMRR